MQALTGTVIHGNGLGHTIGFPTANMFCDNQELDPGTRRFNVVYEGNTYVALGPYFPERNLLEVHLLAFEGDLYDKELILYPLYKIRENQAFDDFADLVKQIEHDKATVLAHPVSVMTFGTFDYFHPGHTSYLSQAKRRGDNLITVIARDTTVAQIKQKKAVHTETQRKQAVEESGLADKVVLGDTQNHYQCLLDYQPQIICLGYDQRSFEEGIQRFYEQQGRTPPQIIRLSSFEPDKYKSSYFSST